ncbi:hypothetical protein SAY87_024687 [Trapa incisa]|uniref:BOI-related E3 ubiquitin-protein ligase 3 n=1 Tax=Trapa incisa TaxID=236973 RepID=A0AAN7JFA3_9MYRT|nr:hypothetical protein SAY87_024687 [Trapa incisa]
MAIEAQLPPEIGLGGGLPMFGLPSSSSHQDYGGGCEFNLSSFSMGQSRKRQIYEREQPIQYTQQLQSHLQPSGHRRLCSVSDFQDRVKEVELKDRNLVGLDQHGNEMDEYLRLQGEGLRWMLKEQRLQQEAAVLSKIESRARWLIQQKDREIALVSKRTVELQSLLGKLEAESQAWQRLSQEKGAMVVSLNTMLEQVRSREEECAESCCEAAADRGEGERMEARKGVVGKMVCRGCNDGESCILFLPCRHLCSCKSCEAFLERCPVCGTPKKASIEALIL